VTVSVSSYTEIIPVFSVIKYNFTNLQWSNNNINNNNNTGMMFMVLSL